MEKSPSTSLCYIVKNICQQMFSLNDTSNEKVFFSPYIFNNVWGTFTMKKKKKIEREKLNTTNNLRRWERNTIFPTNNKHCMKLIY